MPTGFAAIPRAKRYVLSNATLPAVLVKASLGRADRNGLVAADITVKDGTIERVDKPGRRTSAKKFDLDGGMVWPCFVDMHTHIDKGHIWPRKANLRGTFAAALDAVDEDRRANWTSKDVAARMEFSLRAAYAHGTALLRTHIDSSAPQHAISWPVFARMRERWAGRVDLQGVSLFSIEQMLDEAFAEDLAAKLVRYGGVLGAATFMIPELDRALDRLFRIAKDYKLDIDLHVDESEDPAERSLRHVADAALGHRFKGRINVAHICSLTLQEKDEQEETMARVGQAGISVVSLPMCNMYLQDRHVGRTPRWRGITLVHELTKRGVPVAVASDNTRDPFYAYGDLDMVEVLREAVRIVHFDHPFGNWPATVARIPAAIIGRPDRGIITAGGPADLVLFRARDFSELLARPQSDRTVLRSGKPIDTTPPDYRELDELFR